MLFFECRIKLNDMEVVENIMKRILLNKKYIAKLATCWTSGIFGVLGLIGTFVSLSDLLDPTFSLKCRIAISVGILVGVWLAAYVCCSIYVYAKRRVEIFELNGNHHIYVQYGDVFSENEVLNPQERRSIVIPVNRCFDTKVDNDLISAGTLHGIAMNRLYHKGIFDSETLNAAIQQDLTIQQIPYQSLSLADKRKGNLKRFPVGTVAEIAISDKCTYFFLGLSSFDKNLKASTSVEEYVLALQRLLEFCNCRAQQFPVVIPLIGAGLSRTNKNEREILEYLIGLIKMNKELIHFDLHIIVRESGKNSIPINDL